jgi:alanine dehydrogenase
MKVGIPCELLGEEKRVAATPKTVTRLKKLGFEVFVETNAGELSSYSDQEYIDAGAVILADANALYKSSDIILIKKKLT